MKNEKDFKTIFKKSVKRSKGHSITLAIPMFAGIPDLYVVIPEYLPVLLEAKWLKKIERDKFSRKVPLTEMQIEWIKNCDNIINYSAMLLVGFIYKEETYCALVKYGTPLFYNFTQAFLTDCAFVKISKTEKVFDIVDLFSKVPIPRLQPKVGDTTQNYDSTNIKQRNTYLY